MADNKYFPMYYDYLGTFEELTDAELGRLVRSLMNYAKNGVIPVLDGGARYIFPIIRAQIDRDAQRYQDRCAKNRENVSKRWENLSVPSDTTVYDGIRTDTSVYETYHTKTKTRQDKTKTKTTAPKSPKGEEYSPAFLDFWKQYPRKEAKGAAYKAFQKLKPGPELLEAIKTALVAQVHGDEWTRDGGQYIPHPASWLNARRWEDEPQNNPKPRKLTYHVEIINGEETVIYDTSGN